MEKELRELRRKLKSELSCLKRRFIKPPLPKNSDGKVLVHVGCGEKNIPGFVNVDARPLAHVHVVTDDITSLADFASGSVDLVYMCHVLEHIKRDDIGKVLTEARRVLKQGGVLRISVPDFDKLVEVYNAAGKDMESISRQLMGGQDHQYNVHYGVFNYRRLSGLFTDAGFREISEWDPDHCQYHDFKDRASRKLKVNGKEYPISLNLEAVK